MTLDNSYMLYGMTSDPSERGGKKRGRPNREAYSIDNLFFLAWAAAHSNNHTAVVFSPQASNYHYLHGLKPKKANKVERQFAKEKVQVLEELAEQNGLEISVVDSYDDTQGDEFQAIYNRLMNIGENLPEFQQRYMELVPAHIREKVGNDPEKSMALAEYGIRELAYILLKADQTKIGHDGERSYDELAANLVEKGFFLPKPGFSYPFSSGNRLNSHRPIEPYRVPDNPGARADRILLHDSPDGVREKIEEAIRNGNVSSVNSYLERVIDTSRHVNPQPGTMMEWLPDMAETYLRQTRKTPVWKRAIQAAALTAAGLVLLLRNGIPYDEKQIADLDRDGIITPAEIVEVAGMAGSFYDRSPLYLQTTETEFSQDPKLTRKMLQELQRIRSELLDKVQSQYKIADAAWNLSIDAKDFKDFSFDELRWLNALNGLATGTSPEIFMGYAAKQKRRKGRISLT